VTDAGAAPPAPAPARPAIACARCGAEVLGDQSWCTECGLAARTRLAQAPNWRTPLFAAGAIGLAAIVALIVAFLVLTGDNAPLPTTAAPAAPAAIPPAATTATTPAAVTTAPPANTPTTTITTPAATTTIPPATVPGTPTATTATAPTGAE
jgi:hypothetical protein